MSVDLFEQILLGREEEVLDSRLTHSGQITDFNIWSKVLTNEEMMDWTKCSNKNLNGDILNWNTASWTITNMVEYELNDVTKLCKRQDFELVRMPNLWSQSRAINVCRRFKGSLKVIRNEEEQAQILSLMDLNTCPNGMYSVPLFQTT